MSIDNDDWIKKKNLFKNKKTKKMTKKKKRGNLDKK
jgi:hypothetical protein